jgi:hypothetical protein
MRSIDSDFASLCSKLSEQAIKNKKANGKKYITLNVEKCRFCQQLYAKRVAFVQIAQ